MLNRVALLILPDDRIVGEAIAEMSARRVWARVQRVAIVRVHHMTRRTSRRAVIARLIVGAEKKQQRVEQARALEALEHRVRARERAEAAIAQAIVTALEDAQRVARLRRLVLRQRRDRRQPSFLLHLLKGG